MQGPNRIPMLEIGRMVAKPGIGRREFRENDKPRAPQALSLFDETIHMPLTAGHDPADLVIELCGIVGLGQPGGGQIQDLLDPFTELEW